MTLGKRLYHSTTTPTIKLMSIVVCFVTLLNVYFQTYNDPLFLKMKIDGFSSVWNFHLMYPEELIIFISSILFPAIYYGFIRGVSFFEEAIVINKGLPFFNMRIPYNEIEKFEIIHSKHFVSVRRSKTEDDYMFTVNNVDRVLAILDQRGIKGELKEAMTMDRAAHKKLVFFFFIVGAMMLLVQHSGFIRNFFR